MEPNTEVVNETRKISELKINPRQEALFGELNAAELHDLAMDINANGLRQPPEILPDGTLITGHQRVRACEALDWEEVPVIVRTDLAQQGATAIETRLIEDNLHRRHLDKLDVARCCQRLVELEQTRGKRSLKSWERGSIKQRVAKRLGIEGRTLNRYLQILRTPRAVQNAFSEGKATLVNACKVERLDQADQEAIAEAIQQGEEPEAAIRRYLQPKAAPKPSTKPTSQYTALSALVTALEAAQLELASPGEGVPTITVEQKHVLVAAQTLIAGILASTEDQSAERTEAAVHEVFTGFAAS